MKTFVLLSILTLALTPLALAQSSEPKSAQPVAPSQTDANPRDLPVGQMRVAGQVHVGETAPDFTTTSTSGREVTLSHLRGDWLLLVFTENREDFGAAKGLPEALASTGVRIYGICKDKSQRLRSYVESAGLPFDLLADDTGEISAIYGYYSLEQRGTTRGFVVLDRRGVVRLALQGQAPADQVADLVRYTIVGF
jgi:peroxiredoxin